MSEDDGKLPTFEDLLFTKFSRLVAKRGTGADEFLNVVMEALSESDSVHPTQTLQYRKEIERLTNDNADLRRRQELRVKRLEADLADEMTKNASYLFQLAGQKARVLRAELAVAEVDEVLREAGIEYPLGKRGVEDLAGMVEGQAQRAEEAEEVSRKREEYVRTLIRNLRTVMAPLMETDDVGAVNLFFTKAEAILHNVETELDNA